MAHVIFLDTETGGLDPVVDALLTVGLVEYRDGEIVESTEFRIQPEDLRVEPKALAVNRIDLEAHKAHMLTMGRDEAAAAIGVWMSRHKPQRGRPVIGGHNVSFDMGFMDRLFRGRWRPAVYRRQVCTMERYEFLQEAGIVPPGSKTLGDAMATFGLAIPPHQRHTAEGDAIGSAQLNHAMLMRIARADYRRAGQIPGFE